MKARFVDLAHALGDLGAWVRLHYVYPYPHVDDVIPLMAEGKILPYLDVPFQHASPAVLKAMRRPAHQEKTAARIAAWRKTCPDLALRSTFIVGFPGETEEDFEFLLAWLKEVRINRAGCFKYEPVDGAKANELPGAVPEEVKEERWHRFMAAQQEISRALLAEKIGAAIDVLVDEVDEEGRDRPLQMGRARDRRRRIPQRRERGRARRHREGPRAPCGRARPLGRAGRGVVPIPRCKWQCHPRLYAEDPAIRRLRRSL